MEESKELEMEVKGINKDLDLGCLLMQDCQSYEELTSKQIAKRTVKNICTIY
jgi:hypothetical protein